MQPHHRYTMNINSNARNTLINAGGVVEKVQHTSSFWHHTKAHARSQCGQMRIWCNPAECKPFLQVLTLGALSNEFSARVYETQWKFAEQGLPADLIARCHIMRTMIMLITG